MSPLWHGLSDVVLLMWISWCVICHSSLDHYSISDGLVFTWVIDITTFIHFRTLGLRPTCELTCFKTFFTEVVSVEVDHNWTHLSSSNDHHELSRSDGPHSLWKFGAPPFGWTYIFLDSFRRSGQSWPSHSLYYDLMVPIFHSRSTFDDSLWLQGFKLRVKFPFLGFFSPEWWSSRVLLVLIYDWGLFNPIWWLGFNFSQLLASSRSDVSGLSQKFHQRKKILLTSLDLYFDSNWTKIVDLCLWLEIDDCHIS